MSYENHVKKLLLEDSLTHLLAGLAAECGEVAGIFQKALYKKSNSISKGELLSEMGDVLFYLTALAIKYGYTLKDLQTFNIEKLTARHGGTH